MLDTRSHGTLHVLEEGELFRTEVLAELRDAVPEAARLSSSPGLQIIPCRLAVPMRFPSW